MTTATVANFQILGSTDTVTTCECCGKSNLKKSIELGILDSDGNVVDVTYYGTDCAAAAILGKKSSSNRRTIETQAGAIAYGRKLVAKGHTPKVVAMAVWNRFGFLTEVKPGRIVVAGAGEIPLS